MQPDTCGSATIDINGYWVGQYELPIQEALVRPLGPGMVFFDIGANARFFTLVGAKLWFKRACGGL